MFRIKIEDWLRLSVVQAGKDGMVSLPCDKVLGIADYIERHREIPVEKTCLNCKHFPDDWDTELCDGCTKEDDHWERRTAMRLIDADALMEAIQTDIMGGLNYESFIKEAPTIDAVPRWVPCEERLPEKEKPYHRRDFYLTTNAYGAVNVTTYEFENDFQKRGWQSDIRIIAWMPLPEPYEGERKDDEDR